MTTRKIIFTTGIRSDYFIQNPIIKSVAQHSSLEAELIVTGAHLSKNLGYTASEIYQDGHNVVAEISSLFSHGNQSDRAKGAAIQLQKIIEVFVKRKPDFIISPYDREESIVTALAGVYLDIPVAHLGAGDRTRVNVDGIIRHSVSKLAHLQFCSTNENALRLLKMGEEEFRVKVVGHSAVERYESIPLISEQRLSKYLGIQINEKPLIVVIQHPVSNFLEFTRRHISTTLDAIAEINLPTVIIRPNSDPGAEVINNEIDSYKFNNNMVKVFNNMPDKYFVNMLKRASILVGNSSMGVAEAPYLKLPVVNIGQRQKDRQNAGNIIFVNHNKDEIITAVKKSLYDREYRSIIGSLQNPYIGGAGDKIAKILSEIEINRKLLNKITTY